MSIERPSREHQEQQEYHDQKPMVECQGVWLRKVGKFGLEVLVEVGGTWRVAIRENWPADGCGEISHIVEPAGILKAPHDSSE